MAQGQDTGKAPENAVEAAPKDDFDAAFAQLSEPDAPVLAPAGAAGAAGAPSPVDGAGGATGPATGATGAAAGQEDGLPDPKAAAAGATGAAGAPEPQAGATGAAGGATGPAPGATGAAPPVVDPGKAFLDELRGIIQPPKREEPAEPAVTPWTAEQQAAVVKAREEYPEVFEAVDLEIKRAAQTVVGHVFANILPTLQALQGQVADTSAATHEQQVMAAVPDMAEIAPKVMDWIEKQPSFLKAAYEQVAQKGTVQEVADMVAQYRAATGTAAPAPKPANVNAGGAQGGQQPDAAAQAAAEAARQEAARKRIAQSVAPVAGKRTGTAVDVLDREDFDGAFESFAKPAA